MIKHNIVYTNFCDWTFTLTKAEGSYLWDERSRKYIDFTSGWNVTNLGWNNPEIKDAMKIQTEKNQYVPMWMNDDIQAAYAAQLVHSMPKGLDAIIRATGGTDANEKALMLARSLTGRKKIIGFTDTYHGHSYGTISVGYRPEYITGEAPVVPEFIQMTFPVSSGDIRQDSQILDNFLTDLERILKKRDVAAIITEAGIITGWGSTSVAPTGYLSGVRKLTERYGTLLILDEVGTGFSRCGKLFGMEFENITPDMVTLAKGMTNGAAAVGAVVTKSEFGEKELSQAKTHSTFGWTSIGCAASVKALEIHKRDRVWEKSATLGIYVLQELNKRIGKHPNIGKIQGKGLEIGVMFETGGKPDDAIANMVIKNCHANGLHVVFGGDGNIQLMPPLNIEKKVLQEGLDIFISAVVGFVK